MTVGCKTIAVSPIGKHDAKGIRAIQTRVSQVFGYPSEILPLLENLNFAFDVNRRQYFSTRILDRLATLVSPPTVKVLAVTDVDLFIPILTHVFGEAQLGGRACIVSTYRLAEGLGSKNGNPRYYRRLAKEAIHELGHTFSLRHCKDKHCIMHYCRVVEDVDTKSERMCRYCRVLLADEKARLED